MAYEIFNNFIPPLNKGQFTSDTPRARARKNNEQFYIPVNPCIKGHSLRYVSTKKCLECDRIGRPKRNKKLDAKTKKIYWLKNSYNLTLEQYEKLLNDQKYLCKLCELKLELNKTTHIDHCHKTKIIRGILCHSCNIGIGHLKHNPNLLRKAALYCEAA